MESCTVSVTIPTKDSAFTLARCLESVHNQGIPTEIIIADDCSRDDTRIIATDFGAKFLDGPLPLLEARYQGFLASCGDLVILLDSDQFLKPGALRRCLDVIEGCDFAFLEEISAGAATWVAKLFEADRRLLHCSIEHHVDARGGGLLPRAFRRAALEAAFEAIPAEVRRSTIAQDHAIIYASVSRHGGRSGFVRDALAHEEMSTLREVWKKYFRWGRGLVRLFDQAPDCRRLTAAAARKRLHRGGAAWRDYGMSLALLVMKSLPYGLGFGCQLLAQRLGGSSDSSNASSVSPARDES